MNRNIMRIVRSVTPFWLLSISLQTDMIDWLSASQLCNSVPSVCVCVCDCAQQQTTAIPQELGHTLICVFYLCLALALRVLVAVVAACGPTFTIAHS